MNLQSLYDLKMAEQDVGAEVAALPRRDGAPEVGPRAA
jgi:hypothetical protein